MKPSTTNTQVIPLFPALMRGKCARCRIGNMFKGPLSNVMYHKCNNCGLTFERNPGYFYTAMYVTYVFNVAEIVALGVAIFILSGGSNNPWLYVGITIPGILLLAPLNYRYSRVIQMYWLDPTLKYDASLSRRKTPADKDDS
ncbi:DUF983 domain-containing protein [Olivibacter sp. SDN3]|uniref:DUF983 domain-containing protein n=1 Tax=Olivibacter sp. SDN3 TaxID=2764720 RepID=UPI0016512D39|nr:DUF983 domain-containing protein [Olivibacter sp. SDN3]QNL52143.1 DUF983 domain-containing protein [Olivibacter sp. SDN3]